MSLFKNENLLNKSIHRSLIGLLVIIRLSYNSQKNYVKCYIMCKWILRYIFTKPRLVTITKYNNTSIGTIEQRLKRFDLASQPKLTAHKCKIDHLIINHSVHVNIRKILQLIRSIKFPLIKNHKFFVTIAKLELQLIIKELKSIRKYDKVIFHNEKQYWEGLYCIAFNQLGIKTYSIFHGFSRDTGKKIELINTNPFNYKEQLAKYQICWGSVHENIVKKYSRSDIIHFAIGKPELNFGLNYSLIENQKILNLFILDSCQLNQTNKVLIDLFNKTEGAFIKSHPDDNAEYPRKITKSEVIGPNTIIWGCNSSAVLQLGRFGMKIRLIQESDFLKYIDEKYKVYSKNYCNIYNYNWSDFIYFTENEYYEKLVEILEST